MNCKICKRELNNADDPLSVDCGGDCLMCMAEAGDPDCLAKLWVFSFGQSHAYRVDGVTLDKDALLGIVGTVETTRTKMFELFGAEWSMQYQYNEHADMKYFPRGIVKWMSA